jgi:hypothetical protein
LIELVKKLVKVADKEVAYDDFIKLAQAGR